jgi:hypothetical protein
MHAESWLRVLKSLRLSMLPDLVEFRRYGIELSKAYLILGLYNPFVIELSQVHRPDLAVLPL